METNHIIDKKEKNSISVIIPAYNEEKSIEETINKVKLTLKKTRINHEIIVIDDGSKDKTKEIIKNKFKDIILIEQEENRGYGASLKEGIKNAKYKWIAITDADGTYPIEEISKLLEYIPKYTMVVGARTKKGAKIPSLRKPAKWFLNKLANYLTKTKIPDLNSGLRVFRKDAAERFESLLPDGFSFTTTITIACLSNNYKLKYLPIDYYKREGKSSINPVREFVNFTLLIVKIILYFKPLHFFIPAALFFILSGSLWAIRNLINSYPTGFLNIGLFSVLLIICGIQIGFLGLLADLVIKRTKL